MPETAEVIMKEVALKTARENTVSSLKYSLDYSNDMLPGYEQMAASARQLLADHPAEEDHPGSYPYVVLEQLADRKHNILMAKTAIGVITGEIKDGESVHFSKMFLQRHAEEDLQHSHEEGYQVLGLEKHLQTQSAEYALVASSL